LPPLEEPAELELSDALEFIEPEAKTVELPPDKLPKARKAQPAGFETFPSFLSEEGEEEVGGELELEEPSELEQLLEAESAEGEAREPVASPAAATAGAKLPDGKEATRPSFFPEEEFGRSWHETEAVAASLQDVELMTSEGEPVEVEAGTGKKMLIDHSAVATKVAVPVPTDVRPSPLRAIFAGLTAAIVGALIWGVLAFFAKKPASPLAAVLGLMVAFNVRVRGSGHTMFYRVVGMIFTLLGSLLGGCLAAAALEALESGVGINALADLLLNPAGLPALALRYYGALDLLSLAAALYFAFRISASKPEA
jgi:hypothetical protein